MPTVDLNADLGESFGRWTLGDDAALLRIVTSANVACGFHAGDPRTLVTTCRDAVAAGVRIGAQVGYRDLAGFGRRFIDVEPEDLYADVLYQLAALDGIARTVGGEVSYVKPHGALYNAAVEHEAQAEAVVRAVRDYRDTLPVLGLPGSALLRAAEDAGMRPVREAFADRAYTPGGQLVSRREPGAVLHDPQQVADRVLLMVTEQRVVDIDGNPVAVEADSICLHGDSEGAVAMANAVRERLTTAGVSLRSFVT
ncbi:LamB/YcsF family protein [Calidifontibacter sp. DB0510]|uniref:5-oxoprolinase subunit A n=1 Tax=Metallococcus carri TaxID=1656884 RepID=A0A967B2H8_9MICO|nr:5-oxoprolinase subunit PxpA [Metallococcus carri]NHN56338.1 LamB/YcsF family protein [Metallococcus carri]NOP35962.1 LamB/YcsF family protein [Calidifontibacter sp. DB2511S]